MTPSDPSPRVEQRLVDLLAAPCRYCGYQGAGYWQAGTHATHCRWYAIGGEQARAVALFAEPRPSAPTQEQTETKHGSSHLRRDVSCDIRPDDAGIAGSRPEQTALIERLTAAETHERHRNLKETMYWFNQYKRLAIDAIDALSTLQQRAEQAEAWNANQADTMRRLSESSAQTISDLESQLAAMTQERNEAKQFQAQADMHANVLADENANLRAERARLREALVKVRAHTSYCAPWTELLQGLLARIERIADAALTSDLVPAPIDYCDTCTTTRWCEWRGGCLAERVPPTHAFAAHTSQQVARGPRMTTF